MIFFLIGEGVVFYMLPEDKLKVKLKVLWEFCIINWLF